MIPSVPATRRKTRQPWSRDQLLRYHTYALSNSLAPATHSAYSSALRSYLDFCSDHNFPIDPTPDTLSFYIVYMSYHIKPSSVASYLSGLQSELLVYFPHFKAA